MRRSRPSSSQLGFTRRAHEGLGHQQPHALPPCHVHPAPYGAHRKDRPAHAGEAPCAHDSPSGTSSATRCCPSRVSARRMTGERCSRDVESAGHGRGAHRAAGRQRHGKVHVPETSAGRGSRRGARSGSAPRSSGRTCRRSSTLPTRSGRCLTRCSMRKTAPRRPRATGWARICSRARTCSRPFRPSLAASRAGCGCAC